MILIGKECKKFIERVVKMINGINKYNVEPVLLMQIHKTDDFFQPIFISKPMNTTSSVFDYLKEIYSDNPIYSRSLKYLDESKIKVKIDKSFYSPVIFTSLEAVPFIKITPKDALQSEFVLPSKYDPNAYFSNSYFIVTDLFKEFVKDKIIYGIDENFRLYSEENVIYDTSAFLYENDINKKFENDFVEMTSPKNLFPLYLDEEPKEKSFIDSTTKELLINLNSAIINTQIKDVFSFKRDIYVVSEGDIGYDKIINDSKNNAIFYVKNPQIGFEMMVFSEFLKVKNKTMIFSMKEASSDKIDSKINYAGMCCKNKDYVSYIFYKYFDIEIGEQDE